MNTELETQNDSKAHRSEHSHGKNGATSTQRSVKFSDLDFDSTSAQESSEIAWVRELISSYPRTEAQLNRPFLSDAEIVKVKDGYVTVSIDTVAEEYHYKILRDPQSLGWLTVSASLSDLAACGVQPQTVSVHLGHPETVGTSPWISEFEKGCEAAAQSVGARISEFRVYKSESILSSATALSFQEEKPTLTRENFAPGSVLYVTGPVGWGNGVALANVALHPVAPEWVDQIDREYRPLARVREGLFVRDWAQACIDTSDGLLFTLDILSEVLNCGFRLNWSSNLIHPLARKIAELSQIPSSIFFAGQNGEFELLFAVPLHLVESFEKASAEENISFMRIGEVLPERKIELNIQAANRVETLDLTSIRNLLHGNVDSRSYVNALIQFVLKHRF